MQVLFYFINHSLDISTWTTTSKDGHPYFIHSRYFVSNDPDWMGPIGWLFESLPLLWDDFTGGLGHLRTGNVHFEIFLWDTMLLDLFLKLLYKIGDVILRYDATSTPWSGVCSITFDKLPFMSLGPGLVTISVSCSSNNLIHLSGESKDFK